MPFYTVSVIKINQNVAMNLATQKEIEYFRQVLGRSYNYTELIVWENEHLNFSNGNIQRNTDPIEIYQYGKGRCGEFAILYAELCLSQGYQARIVVNVFGDHEWDEIKLDGNWTRVDASPTGMTLNENVSYHVGYPLFYEQVWHSTPILALAFQNSSVVDVTSTYRSDHFSLLSPLPITMLIVLFVLCIVAITKFLILSPASRGTEPVNSPALREEKY
jgi:hypothetical protein